MTVIETQEIKNIRKCLGGVIEITYYDRTPKRSFFRVLLIPPKKIKELQEAINDTRFKEGDE